MMKKKIETFETPDADGRTGLDQVEVNRLTYRITIIEGKAWKDDGSKFNS